MTVVELTLEDATEALGAGRPLVIPTDTVYGIAVSPFAPGAVDRLYRAKRRPADVPLAVLVADLDQARSLAVVDVRATRLAAAFWPGPLTLVLATVPGLDLEAGTAAGTVGIRCPALESARTLCRLAGPLATSSANIHGQPPPATARRCAEALAVDYVDGGLLPGAASTVCDATAAELVVLREGPITAAELAEAAAPRR